MLKLILGLVESILDRDCTKDERYEMGIALEDKELNNGTRVLEEYKASFLRIIEVIEKGREATKGTEQELTKDTAYWSLFLRYTKSAKVGIVKVNNGNVGVSTFGKTLELWKKGIPPTLFVNTSVGESIEPKKESEAQGGNPAIAKALAESENPNLQTDAKPAWM